VSHARYTKLIQDFCNANGLQEPERILRGGPIAVDDVTFSVIYSETVNPDVVFLYCDFGDVPVGREHEAYKALLQANLSLYNGGGPSFAVSPESGRVLLADACRIDGVTVEKLREHLVKLADQATEWRKDHFLGGRNTHTAQDSARPRVSAGQYLRRGLPAKS
jgi:hypothetical protein